MDWWVWWFIKLWASIIQEFYQPWTIPIIEFLVLLMCPQSEMIILTSKDHSLLAEPSTEVYPVYPKFCWHNMFFIGCGSIPTSLEVLEIWTQMIHHDPPVFFFGRCSPGYQLANIQKAIENGHRNSWFILIYPLNIVIFDSWFPIVMVITHSYVSD